MPSIAMGVAGDMSTVEVKTADLIGPSLDWAVFCAIYEGMEPTIHVIESTTIDRKPFIKPITFPRAVHLSYSGAYGVEVPWHPSTDWGCGGPLIEAYKLDIGAPMESEVAGPWNANTEWGHPLGTPGPTPLVAACRAIVRAKLGDTVQIPAELVNPA